MPGIADRFSFDTNQCNFVSLRTGEGNPGAAADTVKNEDEMHHHTGHDLRQNHKSVVRNHTRSPRLVIPREQQGYEKRGDIIDTS